MNYVRFACVGLGLILLSACTHEMTFNKAGVTDRQETADSLSCGAKMSESGQMEISSRSSVSYQNCMKHKGYKETDLKNSPNPEGILGGLGSAFIKAANVNSPFIKHSSPAVHAVMSTAGLEPVGPVKAPGCSGIQIVAYANDVRNTEISHGMFQNRYLVAIRNNSNEAKIVTIHVVRNPKSWDINKSPYMSQIINSGHLVSVLIDYSPVRPERVSISKCM